MLFQRKNALTDLVNHVSREGSKNGQPQNQSQPTGTVTSQDGTLVTLGLNQPKNSSDTTSE